MSRLQTAWRVAAKELGLEVVMPFDLKTNAFSIRAEILLRHFGSPKGMLIVSDYRVIEPVRDQIIALGYGFATMTEPEHDWPFTEEEKESFIEMLDDWRWSGPAEDSPEWLPSEVVEENES
jgi:hypothetical protein